MGEPRQQDRTASSTIGRLRRRPDFLAAAEGRRFHTELVSAQGRLRGADEIRDGRVSAQLHLGFTITKRVGHATERNRIRRRLRAALAAIAADAPAIAADVVVIARRPALAAPFDSLKHDLRRALAAVTKPHGSGEGRGRKRPGPPPRSEAAPARPLPVPGEAGPGPTPSRRDAGPARARSPDRHAGDGTTDGQ